MKITIAIKSNGYFFKYNIEFYKKTKKADGVTILP